MHVVCIRQILYWAKNVQSIYKSHWKKKRVTSFTLDFANSKKNTQDASKAKNLWSTASKRKFLGVSPEIVQASNTQSWCQVFKECAKAIRDEHLCPPGVFNSIQSWTLRTVQIECGYWNPWELRKVVCKTWFLTHT